MRRVLLTASISGVLALYGCGGELKEMSEQVENIKNIAESAQDAQTTISKIEQRQKERREKGDTLALSTDELMKYLPSSLAGYTAEEPAYETVNVEGMSYSQVSRSYTSPDKGTVDIQLADYNASMAQYGFQTMMFGIKIRTDNAEKTEGTFQTSNEMINGYETFYKQSGEAEVTYALGGRFIVIMKAEKQKNTDWLKSVAENMGIAKLAAM